MTLNRIKSSKYHRFHLLKARKRSGGTTLDPRYRVTDFGISNILDIRNQKTDLTNA